MVCDIWDNMVIRFSFLTTIDWVDSPAGVSREVPNSNYISRPIVQEWVDCDYWDYHRFAAIVAWRHVVPRHDPRRI